MRILIIGGTGVIGSKIVKESIKEKHDTNFTFMKNNCNLLCGNFLDITQKQNTIEFIKKKSPDIIIHCVALTNVDKCETDKISANKINVQGTENVVLGAKITNSKIVYISTSAVFNGEKSEYFENDKTCPISHYGITKRMGEEIVSESGLPYLILRTDQPYCNIEKWQHTNSVLRTIETLKAGKFLREIRNWKNNPTYVPNFVESLKKLLECNEEGIFHVVGKDYLTRFEMALKTADIFGLNEKLIISINSDELNLPAKRVNVNLQNKKLIEKVGIKMYDFNEGLLEMYLNEKF